jgi:hypothetical protein
MPRYFLMKVNDMLNNFTQSLCGQWSIARDPQNQGKSSGWYLWKDGGLNLPPGIETKETGVPGILQEVFPSYHGLVWYYRTFNNNLTMRPGGRVRLEFTAVDYCCDVWLNGDYLGRHEDPEEPFGFDVSGSIKEKDNLLAVRVLNPTDDYIDGIKLDDVAHSNKYNRLLVGAHLNYGGIVYPVTLVSLPALSVGEVLVRPDWKTGEAGFVVGLVNSTEKPAANVRLSIEISESATGLLKTVDSAGLTVPAGGGEFRRALKVEGFKLWSLESPALYTARISVESEQGAHAVTLRYGYKDFRITNGYFHLNGKRIFLKSSHTGNHVPVSQVTEREDSGFLRKDLIYAKTMGFNTVRFIACAAAPWQLDLCDELGLLVYEECRAAWLLGETPRTEEYYRRSLCGVVRRDRNHVSLGIIGFLNETKDTPVFRTAVKALPAVRALDRDHLLLLSSGRWDCQPSIGSVCNPGSDQWECLWNEEESGSALQSKMNPLAGPYCDYMGDVHIYPKLPQPPEVTGFIRTMGKGHKPVFLSEYGHGSQPDAIQEYLKYEEKGRDASLEDARIFKTMADRFTADWKRYGFDGVYPFAEDFLRASMKSAVRLREKNFDSLRANPMVCGYNLTGLLDHAYTGEGLWTFWREFKPGYPEVIKEGWAPLRWCLFVEPGHGYAGKPLHVEAVLANEDVLKPGKYPAEFRILGGGGIVWEEKTEIELPAEGPMGMPPLAVQVLDCTVELPAGEYLFAAQLTGGGSPAAGRLTFHVSEVKALETNRVITGYGLPEKVSAWFAAKNVQVEKYEPGSKAHGVILVGSNVPEGDFPLETAQFLFEAAEKGGTVIFLEDVRLFDPPAGEGGEKKKAALPFDAGPVRKTDLWLYHIDCITKPHPVFEGVPSGRLMDPEYVGPILPEFIRGTGGAPVEALCGVFGLGLAPEIYTGGIGMGEYAWGKGRVILNNLRLLEGIGVNPVAERILLNLVKSYGGKL